MGMSSPTAGELFTHLIELTRRGSLRARSRTFARGEVVFHEGDIGDTIHLIERGLFAVRTSTTAGRSLIINVLATGDVFGEFAVFTAEGRRTSSVTSLAGGATIAIERDDLRAVLHDSPDLVDALLSAVVTKAENTRVRLVELLAVPADLRVLSGAPVRRVARRQRRSGAAHAARPCEPGGDHQTDRQQGAPGRGGARLAPSVSRRRDDPGPGSPRAPRPPRSPVALTFS